MIGVVFKERQQVTVSEFFQLFKVPFEKYINGKHYDVIIATEDFEIGNCLPKLLIVSKNGSSIFDSKHHIGLSEKKTGVLLSGNRYKVPIYGNVTTIKSSGVPILEAIGEKIIGGVRIEGGGQKIIRIGYDIFDEIEFLLKIGQGIENAQIPTLENHISLLREWILDAGVPIVEIPPIPQGYDFIACLTHDIDFFGIKDHKFDHTFFGFLYRSLSPFGGSGKKTSFKNYRKNLRALMSLPRVYSGLTPDFWYPLDRYSEIEKGLKSTFYFIPYKDHPGLLPTAELPKYRAARYEVRRYVNQIRELINNGHEVGVHGLDAWCDTDKGIDESEVIRGITGDIKTGIRMHWLYFDTDSPAKLEKAGYYYDTTLGYNDAIGYRSGTTQVFRFLDTSNLFELPLHIQDTAMMFPKRMGLSDAEALERCREIVNDMEKYGGALTINWHDRSLAPERNWDGLYMELLQLLKDKKVWFATAMETVSWFERRRNIVFHSVVFRDGRIRWKISGAEKKDMPGHIVRIHYPLKHRPKGEPSTSNDFCTYRDISLFGNSEFDEAMPTG